jgi:hypothetical protein
MTYTVERQDCPTCQVTVKKHILAYFTSKVGGVKWPGRWKFASGCSKSMVEHEGARALVLNAATGFLRFQACGCRGFVWPLGLYAWPPGGIKEVPK